MTSTSPPSNETPSSPTSLKQRLKSTLKLRPACFYVPIIHSHGERSPDSVPPEFATPRQSRRGSSSSEHVITPTERAKQFFSSRFGTAARHRRRHSASADLFRYDPASYALNFDDSAGTDSMDHLRRNFSVRVPSPTTRRTDTRDDGVACA